jgi:hypothetical protein
MKKGETVIENRVALVTGVSSGIDRDRMESGARREGETE